MNVIWSKYIQGTKTLYCSRKLRFNDLFAKQYRELFGLDENRSLKILEIGCGPGALAGALHRWYPRAEIIAVGIFFPEKVLLLLKMIISVLTPTLTSWCLPPFTQWNMLSNFCSFKYSY